MKKKLKKIVSVGSLLLAGLGCANTSPKLADTSSDPWTTGRLTEIAGVGEHNSQRLSRSEMMVGGLPFNSDFYVLVEHSRDSDFYNARLQSAFVSDEDSGVSLGVAAQHSGFTGDNGGNEEAGPLARISGNPIEGCFGKVDLRYFPKTKTADFYGLLDNKDFLTDVFGRYNIDTGNTFLMPGVDWKINKNLFLGLEAGLLGRFGDLSAGYVGIRGGFSW